MQNLFASSGFDTGFAFLVCDILKTLWLEPRCKTDLAANAQPLMVNLIGRFAPKLPAGSAETWRETHLKKVAEAKKKREEALAAAATANANTSASVVDAEKKTTDITGDKTEAEEKKSEAVLTDAGEKKGEEVAAEEKKPAEEETKKEEAPEPEKEKEKEKAPSPDDSDDDFPNEKKELPSDAIASVEVSIAPSEPANTTEGPAKELDQLFMSLITSQDDLLDIGAIPDAPAVPRNLRASFKAPKKEAKVSFRQEAPMRRRNKVPPTNIDMYDSESSSSMSGSASPISASGSGSATPYASRSRSASSSDSEAYMASGAVNADALSIALRAQRKVVLGVRYSNPFHFFAMLLY
jgi:chemotaxis protein histidine kinase CheA